MSTTQPNSIDLRPNGQAHSSPLRSPRLHVAGEVAPEFSPLDAFAIQSRLLAKQLQEQSFKSGNRLSRLPPLTTESPLVVQARSDYFRSISLDSDSDAGDFPVQRGTSSGLKMEVEAADVNRPISVHPRLSRMFATPDDTTPLPMRSSEDFFGRPLSLRDAEDTAKYPGVRRSSSPPPLDIASTRDLDGRPDSAVTAGDSPLPQPSPLQNYTLVNSPERFMKDSLDTTGLIPPPSLFPKRSSSIVSASLESMDGDSIQGMSLSLRSQPTRHMSNSSGMISPPLGLLHYRPGSTCSDASSLPRPSFNFSRPMSRAGTPGTPVRQASSDDQASFILADDSAHTPASVSSQVFPDLHVHDGSAPAPSYIYSKFSLPRGKSLQRSSDLFPDIERRDVKENHELPVVTPSSLQTQHVLGNPPPSPPIRPTSSASSKSKFLDDKIPRPSLECSKLNMEILQVSRQTSQDRGRPSDGGSRSSDETPRGRALFSPRHGNARGQTPMSTTTSDSASTIKPGAAKSQISLGSSTADMPAEQHLAKAISLHEEGGSLNKSTYHLRLAARQGHPTGMLLYALACRHGWGMRPNQAEGVQWLRKAAESTSLEMVDEEPAVNTAERKTRKAQFALSIYELGVSHMNGWGIEQDKALALRCFEIAASWGDVDALAEAGFCYAKGIGCKKNLKKSAGFYREAEAKGMSMVGNSWIHKAKYCDDMVSNTSKKTEKQEKEKKSRSKSRTRKSIFGFRGSASKQPEQSDP